MKKLLLCVSTILAVSCGTNYQPKGFKGGYYDYPVGGKNQYMVGFRGNGYTDSSTVTQFTHRRASELCKEKGFDGYKVLDKAQNDRYVTTASTTNCSGNSYGNSFDANCRTNPGTTYKKSNTELMIECQ